MPKSYPILASVDCGNGMTTGAVFTPKQHRTFEIPSVRGLVKGSKMDIMGVDTIEFEYFDWRGRRYIVGDDVFKLGVKKVETVIGTRRYGSDYHQMLVAYTLTQLGIKKGPIDLAVFVPPSRHAELKDKIKTAFTENPVEIHLKDERSPRTWEYGDVYVIPEALAIAPALLLDDQGEVDLNNALAGRVAVIDLGVFTTDILLFQDGKLSQENIQTASMENKGIHNLIRMPLLDIVRAQSDDFRTSTIEDIDFIIRQHQLTGSAAFDKGGMRLDFGSELEAMIEDYASYIANVVLSTQLNNLAGYRHAILIGGGALMVGFHLKKWYDDKIADLSEYPNTRNISPLSINAVGGLRLLRKQYVAD